MSNRPEPEETVRLLESVFEDYPGSRSVEFPGEGACLQAVVDGEHLSLVKKGGRPVISREAPESPDISVVLNREACEYLAGSRELPNFVTRTRECINGGHENRRMSYEINAGGARLPAKGYLNFARRMGLL